MYRSTNSALRPLHHLGATIACLALDLTSRTAAQGVLDILPWYLPPALMLSLAMLLGWRVAPAVGAGLLVAQLMGAVELTTARIVILSLGLLVVDVALLLLGVRLFDRDTILPRWE